MKVYVIFFCLHVNIFLISFCHSSRQLSTFNHPQNQYFVSSPPPVKYSSPVPVQASRQINYAAPRQNDQSHSNNYRYAINYVIIM